MSKKAILIIFAAPIILIVLAALWMNYSHNGQVFGLYAFSAFKAPIDIRINCAKETNSRVAEKFLLPLDFDSDSKNALREYWHFSYYRECLFKAGYDFYGTSITPTELKVVDGTYEYKNYFAGVSFKSTLPISIVYDNLTNPDLDDYIIASLLLIDGQSVMINFDRSYKVKDIVALESIFAGFESKKDFTSPTLNKLPSPRSDILAYEDTNLFGYLLVISDNHIVTIYGEKSAQSVIESLINSLTNLP